MSTPTCRFCRAPLTRTFLDLGLQPLANSYLTPEQLAAGNEPVFPLHTRVCDRCFLVQADHDVPAEAIFSRSNLMRSINVRSISSSCLSPR